MAVYNDIEEPLKIGDSWENQTGKLVEDFICRNIIVGGNYEGDILTLYKGGMEDGTPIGSIEIPVSVVTPTYLYDIVFYGIKVVETLINGDTESTIYNGESALLQYTSSRKMYAGIAVRSITQQGDRITNYTKRFDVNIQFTDSNIPVISESILSTNYEYFVQASDRYIINIPEGESIDDIVQWVDITDLFTTSFKEKKLKVSMTNLVTDIDGSIVSKTSVSELSTNISNDIIILTYNGSVIINQPLVQIQFKDSSINKNDYTLIGFINDTPVNSQGNFNLESITPGLNQIVVRAQHNNFDNIYTDWLTLNVIYTNNFTGTAIAVNGVRDKITNNGVATLYELVIFSSDREEFKLETYLEEDKPDAQNPLPVNLVKSEIVSASSYNRETNSTEPITYKKYIELENTGSTRYLLIKINEAFYKFISASYNKLTNSYNKRTLPYTEMQIDVCNSNYTYVKSYPISINYDQIVGQANNLFITEAQSNTNATIISDLESSDGWGERDGITYFKISKQGKSILKNPINLNLGDSFTIEMGFKTYNISDKFKPILSIGKLTLYPTQLAWAYDDVKSEKFLKRNAQFQENQDTHIIITVTKNWNVNQSPYVPDYLGDEQTVFNQNAANYTFNLVRIYINGCIDREIILDNAELNTLKNSTLDINPSSSDIDMYLFRVYNTNALSHQEVIKNYISFLPLKTGELSKESVFNKNDIVSNGKISWNKCLGKQNTLLFIYHKGGKFPNRFWGQEDNQSSNDANKKIPCTLVINYANPSTNARYGGILDKLQCKGQGSSAMRYLIWNVNSSLKKFKYEDENGEEHKVDSIFKPFGKLWQEENKSELIPSDITETLQSVKNYYPMPSYTGQKDTAVYKYKKMVGKVNFASSMQSHKVGACKLFDDAYKASTAKLPSGGRKAVHEEPFMYFYIETDEPFNNDYSSEFDSNHLSYDKILELGNQAKFMGFQTWGPGKGDDACSGYDEDLTPEYLILEGGENTEPSVNFQRPWQTLQRLRTNFLRDGSKYNYKLDLLNAPTVTKSESLAEPWKQLLIDDESIVYTSRGAWDIDYGFVEDEVGDTTYYDFSEGAKISLKRFREFYDTVYKYDFTYVTLKSSIKELKSTDLTAQNLNINKKYLIESNVLSIDGVNVANHKSGDVYRFDEPSNKWVRAGVYYDNGDWERLNYQELLREEAGIDVDVEQDIKDSLKELFKRKMSDLDNGYLYTDDIAFHQAFIKFLSGTDNRAKNTYFQIIGKILKENPEYDEETNPDVEQFIDTGTGDQLIRLIGDDLDTILVTDNNGLQSKPYNLLEDSYDETFYEHWGDVGNLFFRMFDLTFEDRIQAKLKNIMDVANLTPSGINNKGTYFYNTFFKVQEDFPQIAYNDTATIYYENAQVIKDCGADYAFTYTNNDIEPIEQSHGSCLQGEKQFMKERIAFLAGYAGSCLDNPLPTASSAGSGKSLKMWLEFEPMQDFYPTYEYEKSTFKNIGNYANSNYNILKYKASAGQTYQQQINESSTAINQSLMQVNLYKTLTMVGIQSNEIKADLDSTTQFTIDNTIIENQPDLFGTDYPTPDISLKAALPVLEDLKLIKVNLQDELDLSTYTKLQNLDLTESTTRNVILPQTGLFKTAILPASIRIFEIYNNPGLEQITFEGLENLETVYIDGSKCGNFDVASFCESLINSPLKQVVLRNLNNIHITEETLFRLITGTNFTITGTITIIDQVGTTEPKNISFTTKQRLVNTFGDIDNGENGGKNDLIIKYTSSKPNNIVYPDEVNAYYNTNTGGSQTFTNLFNVAMSGNNVKIVEGINPVNPKLNHRLHIEYVLSGTGSDVTLDAVSGDLTIKKNPTSVYTVTIKIYGEGGPYYNTKPIKINFQWLAPVIGEFAYSDGSFSKTYNTAKNLVGIVFDKEVTNDNEGYVYLLSSNISNEAEYCSYLTDEGANAGVVGKFSEVAIFISNVQKSFGNVLSIYDNPDIHKVSLVNEITLANQEYINGLDYYNDKDNNGDSSETKIYVDFVNSTILPKLYEQSEYSKYITDLGNSTYAITSLANLNKLCSLLNTNNYMNVTQDEYKFLNASLLFPYFYSAYLYKPKNAEDGIYKDVIWYAPSYEEMAKLIYQRGYSARLNDFISSYHAFEQPKTLELASIQAHYTDDFISTPIFAIAKTLMQNNYPTDWSNVLNVSNSLITTYNNSENAMFAYVNAMEWLNEGTSYKGVWEAGLYSYYYGGNVDTLYAYTPRKGGLVFAKVKYTNPQNV